MGVHKATQTFTTPIENQSLEDQRTKIEECLDFSDLLHDIYFLNRITLEYLLGKYAKIKSYLECIAKVEMDENLFWELLTSKLRVMIISANGIVVPGQIAQLEKLIAQARAMTEHSDMNEG